jgi:hypothetical protein
MAKPPIWERQRKQRRSQTLATSASWRCNPKTFDEGIDRQWSSLNISFYKLRIPRPNWATAFLNEPLFPYDYFLESLCSTLAGYIPWRAIPQIPSRAFSSLAVLLFGFCFFTLHAFLRNACSLRVISREKHTASDTFFQRYTQTIEDCVMRQGKRKYQFALDFLWSRAWEMQIEVTLLRFSGLSTRSFF